MSPKTKRALEIIQLCKEQGYEPEVYGSSIAFPINMPIELQRETAELHEVLWQILRNKNSSYA